MSWPYNQNVESVCLYFTIPYYGIPDFIMCCNIPYHTERILVVFGPLYLSFSEAEACGSPFVRKCQEGEKMGNKAKCFFHGRRIIKNTVYTEARGFKRDLLAPRPNDQEEKKGLQNGDILLGGRVVKKKIKRDQPPPSNDCIRGPPLPLGNTCFKRPFSIISALHVFYSLLASAAPGKVMGAVSCCPQPSAACHQRQPRQDLRDLESLLLAS